MKKDRNRFFRRRICKGSAQIISPELHPQCTHSGIRNEFRYSSQLDIECSYGEVGIFGRRRYEGLQRI